MKMKASVFVVSSLVAAGLIMAAAPASAQLNPFTAPTDAMDTLSGGPTGAPGPSFNPMGRAQNAVNATQGGFGAPPAADPFGAGAPAANPFGAPAGANNPFGAPAGGGFDGGNPFGAAGDSPFGATDFSAAGGFQAVEATLTAWGGERIYCQRTGVMLQDAREISIRVGDASMYYDDGQSGGDAVANDNIYTNILVSRNFISPEAHAIKTKLLRTLEYAMDLSPQQFSLVRVATTEPLSPLPQVVDLEREQDRFLNEWALNFLRDYRLNPDQLDSEFIPTYIPPPPRAPNIPLPASFSPNPPAADPNAPGSQGGPGGGFIDSGVTGEPVGNASSRYF